MKAPAKIATIPATDSARAMPRPTLVLRQSQLAMASKIAPSTIAAKTSMKKRVSSTTSSDSAAAPASATMIVAQFLRSAASAQSRHARIAPARPTSDGTSTWIMSCGVAAHKGWPSRTLRYQYGTTIGSSAANGPFAHCGCVPTSAAPAAMPASASSTKRVHAARGFARAAPNTTAAAATNRSEEHTSELQSLMRISYAVFCLKKKKHTHINLKHIKQYIY